MTIIVKRHDTSQGQPIEPSAFAFGNNGYIRLGDRLVCGNREELAEKLTELARALQPQPIGRK